MDTINISIQKRNRTPLGSFRGRIDKFVVKNQSVNLPTSFILKINDLA